MFTLAITAIDWRHLTGGLAVVVDDVRDAGNFSSFADLGFVSSVLIIGCAL